MKDKQNTAANALSRRIYPLQPISSTSRVDADELIQILEGSPETLDAILQTNDVTVEMGELVIKIDENTMYTL